LQQHQDGIIRVLPHIDDLIESFEIQEDDEFVNLIKLGHEER